MTPAEELGWVNLCERDASCRHYGDELSFVVTIDTITRREDGSSKWVRMDV